MYVSCIIAVLFLSYSSSFSLRGSNVAGVGSITFLVTVNDTWKWNPPIENDTCMVTIKTNSLYPNTPLNKTENVVVGSCDSGPLIFTVNSNGKDKASVYLTFHSSVVLDASPPTCTIDWNYSYRLPTNTLGPGSQDIAEESLLPGCFTADSREGYHMTNYWFYIIDWTLTTDGPNQPKPVISVSSVTQPLSVSSVTFLVAVNQTESKCLMTSRTPPLRPGVLHNQTGYIHVGKCDYGALDFNLTTAVDGKGNKHTYVDVVFHSHDIEDASPPTCKILWDYSYNVPSESNFQSSLLPGCYTTESREGSHMTYFWFYVIDWAYG